MPAYAVSGAFRIRASPRGGIGKAGGSSVRAPPAGPVSLVVRASGGGACADGEVRRVVVRVAAVREPDRAAARRGCRRRSGGGVALDEGIDRVSVAHGVDDRP